MPASIQECNERATSVALWGKNSGRIEERNRKEKKFKRKKLMPRLQWRRLL